VVSVGSDGSFRDRDRAVSSFLLRAREVGRFESLDRGCMCHVRRRSGRGICGKGGRRRRKEEELLFVLGDGQMMPARCVTATRAMGGTAIERGKGEMGCELLALPQRQGQRGSAISRCRSRADATSCSLSGHPKAPTTCELSTIANANLNSTASVSALPFQRQYEVSRIALN